MKPTPFGLADSTFNNARQFRIQTIRLGPFPHIEKLVSETGKWLGGLLDAEDAHSTDLRKQIWQLRSAILYGLFAFDDPALNISQFASSIIAKGEYFPELRERRERLSGLVTTLINNPYNPKREEVLTQITRRVDVGQHVGLVVALNRRPCPAVDMLIENWEHLGKNVQFIFSRRQLLTSTFNHLIVPFGTRQCPLNHEIVFGYRASGATMVAYRSEAMAPHRKLQLPCAIRATGKQKGHSELRQHVSLVTKIVDESIEPAIFGSEIREDNGPSPTDMEYVVSAREILLANGDHVFLNDDSKVIDVSDIVEGNRSLETFERRFPRTHVKQLGGGDLIVLRVKGSGEYLIEVADDLMKRDGKKGLRASSIDWKPILRNVLAKYGSVWFLEQLEKRGYGLASHNYLWKWTTNDVISPFSEAVFYETMAILDDCGCDLGKGDVLETAKRRWEEMRELKRYHKKAGQRIRMYLLRRLRSIIDSRPKIGSKYELRIPGVSAGTMAIVRVADVARKIVSVPYHRVGVVFSTQQEGMD